MAHPIARDSEYSDCDDDVRSWLVNRAGSSVGYRFGRMPGKPIRLHARSAFRRANRYFKKLIEAIANSKLRRMQHELALRGIRYDRVNND